MADAEGEMQSREPLLEQAPPEASRPISAADNDVHTLRPWFPKRDSLLGRILSGAMFEPPSSRKTPEKTALKLYNKSSLAIDKEELETTWTHDYSEHEGEFFVDFGLSGVMAQRVISKCTSTYQIAVLLDNGPSMKRDDSIFIEGKKKNDASTRLPSDKRLARNADYDIYLASCPRFDALKDVSFFLIHLAATLAVPTTFEIFCPEKTGGKGRGFRRIGTASKNGANEKPEDYIPLCDQAESAMEMIENFVACISKSGEGSLRLIEEVKSFYDDEQSEIEKQGGDILVIIVTALLPWGSKREESSDRKKFVGILNDFADLPVTFVFLVESTVTDIVDFYDNLLSPESGVEGDVKVAKGLGIMINGIQAHNPWLNYCLPMHLCQVLGICSNTLSQAAYRPLRAHEVRVLCETFIGDVPDPDEDMNTFLGAIEVFMSNGEHTKWNPVTGYDAPLVDTVKLKRHFTKGEDCCRRCLSCFSK